MTAFEQRSARRISGARGWTLGWECGPPQRTWHGFEKRVAGSSIDWMGEHFLIYIDPESNTPAALFVNSAGARMQNKNVVLGNGSLVRSEALMDPGGNRQAMDRPGRIFNRWYGFALTFPSSEVFGQ